MMASGARVWRVAAWSAGILVGLLALFTVVVPLLLSWEYANSHRQAGKRADATAAQYAQRLSDRLSKGPIPKDQLASSNGIEGLFVTSAHQSHGQVEVRISVTGEGDGQLGKGVVYRCYDIRISGAGRPNPQQTLTRMKACPPPPPLPTPPPGS